LLRSGHSACQENIQLYGGPMYRAEEDEKEIDLLEYAKVVLKRKWVAISFLGACVFFAGVYSFKVAPIYKATSTMMIEEESSKILSIEGELGYRQQVADLRFYNTQLKLLKSYSLIERVVEKLDLLHHPRYAKISSQKNGALADPLLNVTESVLGQINVSPIRETKLVEVSYTSSDPSLAADVVNTLSEEFIEFYIEKRSETTQQASKFLGEQIADLRNDLAVKEAELQKYGEEKGLFFLSDQESTAVNTFADLNAALTDARIDRIKAESSYRELMDLKVDALPQFIENMVIQNLKTEYTNIKNDFEEKRKIYKPDYPEMVQLKARLDSMRTELEGEISRAVEAARTQYRSAVNKENSTQRELDRQRNSVSKMNSDAILYNSIKIEVENMRKLLNSLVERQKETLVSARLDGVKTSTLTIIDRAKLPRHPISPKKKLNLILAFLVGLFGGVGLCFVLDYLDNTVKGLDDLEKLVDLPSLGMVPFLSQEALKKGGRHGYYRSRYSGQDDEELSEEDLAKIKDIELINYIMPRFSISEDYRTVRTSIMLSYADTPPKTIAFTSSLPQEGKTTTVVNMAVAFAQLEKNVLIVDADLRRPRLHRIFNLKNANGISSYLTGRAEIADVIHKTTVDRISLIPSGPIPPNPSELLNSRKMKTMLQGLEKGFDIILIDTPPILAVIDPVIVASIADAVVLIVQSGKTKDKPLISAVEALRKSKARIIGAVFNSVQMQKAGQYYEGYYKAQYQYGGEEETRGEGDGAVVD